MYSVSTISKICEVQIEFCYSDSTFDWNNKLYCKDLLIKNFQKIQLTKNIPKSYGSSDCAAAGVLQMDE